MVLNLQGQVSQILEGGRRKPGIAGLALIATAHLALNAVYTEAKHEFSILANASLRTYEMGPPIRGEGPGWGPLSISGESPAGRYYLPDPEPCSLKE